MSKASPPNSSLSSDERSVFERLADRYEDDDVVGETCRRVLQSSATDSDSESGESEEAN